MIRLGYTPLTDDDDICIMYRMGKTFGARFRAARLERKLSQFQASELIFGTGERQAEISRWESEKGKPGIDALAVIAQRFNMSADELIGVSRIPDLEKTAAQVPA